MTLIFLLSNDSFHSSKKVRAMRRNVLFQRVNISARLQRLHLFRRWLQNGLKGFLFFHLFRTLTAEQPQIDKTDFSQMALRPRDRALTLFLCVQFSPPVKPFLLLEATANCIFSSFYRLMQWSLGWKAKRCST